ncbi:uncharacterized protein EAE98_003041 [Botrytis deweyae]|uniref:Uncharacterized protein n=1 Tax=Botrytis deweyae TaxID=2478750 RepID=A0ABQ7IVF9_9HELO|nr:uncharacterized protein EAE98_003041 [Botrytis deweyae]KAF7934996.1 hypothetical protein EAE98_003041 [Botrytis deweyae]
MLLSPQKFLALFVAFGLHNVAARALPRANELASICSTSDCIYDRTNSHRGDLFPRIPGGRPITVKPEPKPKPITEPNSPAKPDTPTTVDPATTTSNDAPDVILTPTQYKTRGDTVQNNLKDAITKKAVSKTVQPAGTDPVPGDGSVANVFDGYDLCNLAGAKPGVSVTNERKVYEDLEGTFAKPELNIPSDTSFTEMHWFGAEENLNAQSSIVNWGGYNADKGIIVVNDVDSRNDFRGPTDPKKLASSSITYQSFQAIAGTKVGGLKIVVQKNVPNPGSRKMIADAYKNQNLNIDSDTGDWAMDANNSAKEKAFLTLLGTDNGRPTINMLTDFHDPLGNKKVTRILTYPHKDCEEELNDGLGCWHMALMIGTS